MCIHHATAMGTVTRTVVFTILHLGTAFTVSFALTGEVETATLDALLEPGINSIWYLIYALDFLL